jgi:hypothetical protein
MQLHLELDLLRLARGDVEAGFAHRLDHVEQDCIRRSLTGGLGV